MSRWIHEMKWPEVAEYLKSNDTALIPVGSTEQHGSHMAMMTDAAEAIDVAGEVAERTGVLVTPPLWFGWTPHHMSFPGTICLRAETLTNVVEDICVSLTYHGFKKLILINGHRGANLPPLEIAQARVRQRTNCYMVLVDVQMVARKEIGEILDGDPAAVGHACEIETSHMLYTHPDMVDMSKASGQRAEADPKYMGSFTILNPFLTDRNAISTKLTPEENRQKLMPSGVYGDASRASREKGQRIFEAIVANTVEIVEQAKQAQVSLKPIEPPV